MDAKEVAKRKAELQREMKAWWRVFKDLLKIEIYDYYGSGPSVKSIFFECQTCGKRANLRIALDHFTGDEYDTINTIVESLSGVSKSCEYCNSRGTVDPVFFSSREVENIYKEIKWN